MLSSALENWESYGKSENYGHVCTGATSTLDVVTKKKSVAISIGLFITNTILPFILGALGPAFDLAVG